MAAALLAIGLAARAASGTIGGHCLTMLAHHFLRAGCQILVDDSAQKSVCRHGIDLEKPHLIRRHSNLGNGVINDGAQLGVELNLKRIGAHGGGFNC